MELDSIDTVRKQGEYGNVFSQSPNANYRRYRSWFDKKYGTTRHPLSFKEWLKWAHEQEVVARTSAGAGQPQEEAKGEEKVAEVVNNAGRNIAILIMVAASIGFIVAFTKTKTA